ncbi:hypothetical protein LTR17_013020 [Elasticomyces elasticus]|nr:hypothetical protein LTR17_013020 [Elasticomyces elasticus]
MLTTEQQLECMNTIFPLSIDGTSDYARAWLRSDYEDVEQRLRLKEHSVVEQLSWQELNPRYLSPSTLQMCTGYLLPASVTAPGHEGQAITPHRPIVGPFACAKHDRCKPALGECIECGRNHGLRGSAGYEAPTPRQYRNIDAAVHHLDQQFEEGNREGGETLEQAAENSRAYKAKKNENQSNGGDSAMSLTAGDKMDIDSWMEHEA